MDEWTIYHNPKCSKSREALALLRGKGIEPRVVEYLKQPLTDSELRSLAAALELPAKNLVRRKELLWQQLSVDESDEASIIAAIASHPVLLERPVIVRAGRAVIGRPTDNILSLF